MGGPKALLRRADGTTWLDHACTVLLEGGCDSVLTVLGACSGEAASDMPGALYTVCDVWAEGIGASLAHGLRHLAQTSLADAVVIHLVDLPDVTAEVVSRIVDRPSPSALRRGIYDGVVGHPVLVGREHWSEMAAEVSGDRGAQAYLRRHGVVLIECGDLATGHDIDSQDQLRRDSATD